MVPLHGSLTIGRVSEESMESELLILWDIGVRSFILDLENASNLDSSGIAHIVDL
jgi:anti-anti-sigma regulatory factor